MKAAFWATVAGQVILLVAFIAVKENTLRTGTSVLLQTAPVDPRSLFQGDYAILNYEIAVLPDRLREIEQGNEFFVELVEDADGVWRSRLYTLDKGDLPGVFIKGKVVNRGRLDFGIGTYFIPEGTGRAIEQAEDVKVRVAIGSGGKAVIEELLVDGQPFEPSRPVELPPKDRPPRPAEPLDGTPQPKR